MNTYIKKFNSIEEATSSISILSPATVFVTTTNGNKILMKSTNLNDSLMITGETLDNLGIKVGNHKYLCCIISVTDTDNLTLLAYYNSNVSKVYNCYKEITLEEFKYKERDAYGYQFNSTGEQLINYELTDGTFIETSMMYDIYNGGVENIQSIIIPNTVTNIKANAFNNCTSLTSVTIPNSVTSIGKQAFYSCDSLTSVTLGNSVTSIGEQAFEGCTSLTSVTIPDSVINIGNKAFKNNYNLITVTCESTTPPTLGTDVFTNNSNLTTIYVPSESVDVYKTATHWSSYSSKIQAIS